jgi:hypothetical protein
MPLPPDPTTSRIAPIRAWRCVRHPEREAAARCPVCGQPYCRECVVEHGGRLVCTVCLAKLNTPAAPARQARNFAPLRASLSVGAAALVLWFVFFYSATLLTRIPTQFHDATIWQELTSPRHGKPARTDRSPPAPTAPSDKPSPHEPRPGR